MKLVRLWPCLLLMNIASLPIYADDSVPPTGVVTAAGVINPTVPAQGQGSDNTKIIKYLLSLGKFLGYDLKASPPETPSATLVDLTKTQLFGSGSGQSPFFQTVVADYLGSIPVDSLLKQFIPSGSPVADAINALANNTFKDYGNASATSKIAADRVIDQDEKQSPQGDPVTQAVLNLLSTPDESYCKHYDGTLIADCSLLDSGQVKINVVGELPPIYYSIDYNKNLLSQLNVNTLLAPLIYTTEADSNNNGSNPQPKGPQHGLMAQTQAQQAVDFIRYASGSVVPVSLPQSNDYASLYAKAVNKDGKAATPAEQEFALDILTTYFTKLRAYVAQLSVGYGNLYYILSKRMPQQSSNANGGPATSQAFNEFTMATWRLFDAKGAPNQSWLKEIDQASPATVQKEIATLLAEMNYQLYLNRQQEERILLTNTMMIMMSSRAAMPAPPSLQSIQQQQGSQAPK